MTQETDELQNRDDASPSPASDAPPSLRFRVQRFEWTSTTIQPRQAPEPIEIPVLRLYPHPDDIPDAPLGIDITSRVVQAQLRPLLDRLVGRDIYLRLRKRGAGIGSVFTVSVES